MTEKEALTKWCPKARVAIMLETNGKIALSTTGNRLALSDAIQLKGATDKLNPESARCIGSACMAWRWDDVPNPEYERQSQSMLSYGGSRVPMTLKSETDGHCGLAGRP